MSGRTRSLVDRTWQEKSREGPPPRHNTTLTSHTTRGTVVLFGGTRYEGKEQLPLDDMWEWDGKRWKEIR
jgi:hypothetical protein